MTTALVAGLLVAGGAYLILQRGLVRVAFGFVLLGHAANVVLMAAGGTERRGAPLVAGATEQELSAAADPLPQAFALTAIVITFALTVYLLGLVRAGGDDDPGDVPEGGGSPEAGTDGRTGP